MKKHLITGIAILGMITLSTTATSCSAPRKALKEQNYEWEKKTSDLLSTKVTKKGIEIGAIGLARTRQTAEDRATMNARSKVAEFLGNISKVEKSEEIDNSIIAETEMVEVSTTELYNAVKTSSASALLSGSYPTAVEIGHDETGKLMAVVRVFVPFKGSKTLLD